MSGLITPSRSRKTAALLVVMRAPWRRRFCENDYSAPGDGCALIARRATPYRTNVQRWPVRPDGGDLVHHQRVEIKREPVPQAGHAVGEVESRKAFSRILGDAGLVRVVGAKEVAPGERKSGAAEHSRNAHAKFQVRGGLKADLGPMNKRLRVDLRADEMCIREHPLLSG